MRQEDYNSMMSDFPLKMEEQDIITKNCPRCFLAYLGDGLEMCVDCEKEEKKTEKQTQNPL